MKKLTEAETTELFSFRIAEARAGLELVGLLEGWQKKYKLSAIEVLLQLAFVSKEFLSQLSKDGT